LIFRSFHDGRKKSEKSQKNSKIFLTALNEDTTSTRIAKESGCFDFSFFDLLKARIFLEMRRKTEIIFETEELIVFKARRSFTGFCEQCREPVEMLTTEIAAALSGFGEREIFRLIETGAFHFVEAERVFVCRKSLMKGLEPTVLKGAN